MKKLISIFLILMLLPIVSASGFGLRTNQTDYYFTINDNVFLPVEVFTSYENSIEVLITTSISQRIDREETLYSSPKTESRTFIINPGINYINIGFGSSITDVLMKVKLTLDYKNISVALDEVILHFVDEGYKKPDNFTENFVFYEEPIIKETKTFNYYYLSFFVVFAGLIFLGVFFNYKFKLRLKASQPAPFKKATTGKVDGKILFCNDDNNDAVPNIKENNPHFEIKETNNNPLIKDVDELY